MSCQSLRRERSTAKDKSTLLSLVGVALTGCVVVSCGMCVCVCVQVMWMQARAL